jgi:hypothetical protein
MDVVKKGVLIKSTTKLGNGSNGVSAWKKLNGSSSLPTTTIGVVGTPQMVFTNSITIIHVNRTEDSNVIIHVTINELNGCWRVQKCKCNEFKRRILRTIYCNCTNSWSQIWPLY